MKNSSNLSIIIDMHKVDKIINPIWLLSHQNNSLLKDHSIVIDGNTIRDILPKSSSSKKYNSDNNVILSQHLAIPGLIHSYNDSSSRLMETKNHMKNNSKLKSHIDHEESRVNSKYHSILSQVTIAEMIKNGITTFSDIGLFPDTMIDQAIKSKVKCNIGFRIQNNATEWANNENHYLEKSLRIYDLYKGNPDIKFFFNPASINHISRNVFEKISKIANELDIPIQMNVNSSEIEIKECMDNHGCTPFEYLESLDVLNNKFTIMNSKILSNNEIELIKKYRLNIVIDKSTKILSKNFNIIDLIHKKVNLILSSKLKTKHLKSEMLDDMSIFSWLMNIEKHQISTNQIFNCTTINPALSFGTEKQIGTLMIGYSADIVSINIKDIIQSNLLSFDGIERNLKSSNIDNVWISGNQVMKNKKLLTIEENKMYDRFRKISK